jgi:autotransporter-associated beta strand protein
LTLEQYGIDMTNATRALQINAPVTVNAPQTWYVGPNVPNSLTTARAPSGLYVSSNIVLNSTLTIDGPGNTALGINSGGSVNTNITGAGGITKNGAGTLIVGGVANNTTMNNLFTGAFTLNSGTVLLPGNTSVESPLGVGNLIINGGMINVAAQAGAWINNTNYLVARDFAIDFTGPNNNANLTIGTNGVSAPFTLSGGDRTITVGVGAGTANYSATINAAVGSDGNNRLIKDGVAVLKLANAVNTFTGGVTMLNGTLEFSGATADAGFGALPASVTPNYFILNGGRLLVDNTLTINANRGMVIGPTYGIGAGVLDAAASKLVTYNGLIADNGAGHGTLVLGGSSVNATGGYILGGNNTFSGGLVVRSGTQLINSNQSYTAGTTILPGGILKFGAATRGNLGQDVTGNNVMVQGGVLQLQGVGGGNNLGANQTLTMDSVSGSLGVLGWNQTTGLPTVNIYGTGAQTYGSVLALNGQTYTANITLADNQYLGAIANSSYSGTSLPLDGSGNYRLGGGGGQLTIANAVLAGANHVLVGENGQGNNGNGTVVLTAANGYTSTTTISGKGTVLILTNASGSIASGTGITVNDGATLKLSNAGANMNNRLGGQALTLNGLATLQIVAPTSGSTVESIGALTVGRGVITIASAQAVAGQTASTIFTSLTRSSYTGGNGQIQYGSMVYFNSAGLGSATNTVQFTDAGGLTLQSGILPWGLAASGVAG